MGKKRKLSRLMEQLEQEKDMVASLTADVNNLRSLLLASNKLLKKCEKVVIQVEGWVATAVAAGRVVAEDMIRLSREQRIPRSQWPGTAYAEVSV